MKMLDTEVSGDAQSIMKSLQLLAKHLASKKNLTNAMIDAYAAMENNFYNLCQFLNVQTNPIQNQIVLKGIQHKNQKLKDMTKYMVNSVGRSIESLVNQDNKRGPYRSYTNQTKQHVIQLHEEGLNFNSISKKLHIPPKNIVRWCRYGATRKPGAGRKVFDPEMEELLLKWLEKYYSKEESLIEYSTIQEKAKELSKNIEFSASNGWLKNFINRHQLNKIYSFKKKHA